MLSVSSRARASYATLLTMFFAAALSWAQVDHQWTERENLGFKGPVRSARTTVTKVNPDPRLTGRSRRLFVERDADWVVFDQLGRRIEMASGATPGGVISITKCTFAADGSKICRNGSEEQVNAEEKRTKLPDGRLEVTFFYKSKKQNRQVTQFDEKGKAMHNWSYGEDDRLLSEDWTSPDGDQWWKVYDTNGTAMIHLRTRQSQKPERIERWSYDSDGELVWNMAVNGDGDLLSYWYRIGFKPKPPAIYSLGISRPGLCVDYNFDPEGSGRLDKHLRHVQGGSYLEPDSEEHYDFAGVMDEKVVMNYIRDAHGNWTSRSVFVWNSASNTMTETERDTRMIEYY